ncbi:MAG: MBL fold metallo-hydrolase [Euryarchaeota archaeon]|nr:MBL fold metallo-hydrolase [Euryarchaeota archaeon]
MEVFPNIFRISHQTDSNVYLIKSQKIILIDAGGGQFNKLMLSNIKKIGILPKDIELIIHTHCHYDHIAGDIFFLKNTPAKAAIHELDAEPLTKGNAIRTLASLFLRTPEPIKVDLLLKDGQIINVGDFELEVIHTPGHSRGSICLYERELKLLFSGDTVFPGGSFGRADLPGGNFKDLVNSLLKLAKLNVMVLLPGHGSVITENGNNHIRSSLEMAQSLLEEGLI